MSNTFAISDLHFGHKRIIELCNRPFSSVEEMDDQMVSRWNSVVGDDDTVFFGGDFQFYKNDRYFFDRLNGRYKNLILGNHDHEVVRKMNWSRIDKRFEFEHRGKWFVLDHYPIEDWNKRMHGSIHLYGHVHTQPVMKLRNRFSMCAEHLNYTPRNLDDYVTMSYENKLWINNAEFL